MISQRPQPAYDPMAQMMQILQLALAQNQQVSQQENQDRRFQLDERQLAQQLIAQQQAQANAERGFAVDEQRLNIGEKQFAEQQKALLAEQAARESQNKYTQLHQNRAFDLSQQQFAFNQKQAEAQQKLLEQQAILSALSRAVPQTAMGMDDPTALYSYLQSLGVQVPMQAQQQAEDPQVTAAKAQWAAMQQKLLQQ